MHEHQQKNTKSAINELQNFLNNYPNSTRSKNISNLIEELSYKLQFKAFEIAHQYFKMADYKAAVVSFENMLSDYPATKLKPKAVNYIMRAKAELAYASVFDKKEERLASAIAYAERTLKNYPDSENSKDATKILKDLKREKESFMVLKKQRQERIDRRKERVEKLQKTQENEEEQMKTEKDS